MRVRRTVLILSAAAAAAVVPPDRALRAATFDWTGPGGAVTAPRSGDWNVASNWYGGVLPVSDPATILSFGPAVPAYATHNNLSVTPFTLGTLRLGGSSSGPVSDITLSGAPLRFSGAPVPGGPANHTPGISTLAGSYAIGNDLVLDAQTYLSTSSGADVSLAGTISGAGGLRIQRAGVVTLTRNNTYAGTTEFVSGILRLSGAGTVGSGAVNLSSNSVLLADGAGGFKSDGQVTVASRAFLQFNTLTQAAVNRILGASAGVLGVGANTTAAPIDLSNHPNLWLGVNAPSFDGAPAPTVTFAGQITPGQNTYRFGGNYGAPFSTSSVQLGSGALEVASHLSDAGPTPRTVRIGDGGMNRAGRIKLTNAANSYSGGTIVEPTGALYIDSTPQPGQTPLGTGDLTVLGQLIIGGSGGGLGALPNDLRFQPLSRLYFDKRGAAGAPDHWPDARPLTLNSATLTQRGSTTVPMSERIGALTISGHARAALDSTPQVGNALEFASLTRVGNATLELRGSPQFSFGGFDHFKIGSAAGVVDANSVVVPWIIGNTGDTGSDPRGEFLRLDAANVFQKAAYTTGNDPNRDDELVEINSAFTQSRGVAWGMKFNASTDESGYTQTIRGGGLILNAANVYSGGLMFRNGNTFVPATVYVNGASELHMAVDARAGLTKFGEGTLRLFSAYNNISGGVTINQGEVEIRHANGFNAQERNALAINAAARLDLFGNDLTVTSLSGDGGRVINALGNVTATLTVDQSIDTTFAGRITNVDGSYGAIALTKSGPGTLTLAGANGYSGLTWVKQGTLNVNGSSTFWIGGSHYQTWFGGRVNFNATAQAGGIDGDGQISVNTGGALTATHVRQRSLAITGTGHVVLRAPAPAATGPVVSKVNDLTIDAGARLDLTKNAIIVDYPADAVSPRARLEAYAHSGLGDGQWGGPGLMTSARQQDDFVWGIGIAEARELFGLHDIGADTANFGGQAVDATSVIVRYTKAGDANLDGFVDGGDYAYIDVYVGSTGADVSYLHGDFNYDGFIDGGDYAYIDVNAMAEAAAAPAVSRSVAGAAAVPETGSVTALTLLTAALIKRRRRRA